MLWWSICAHIYDAVDCHEESGNRGGRVVRSWSKHATGRVKNAIGIEIEGRRIAQNALNVGLIDCGDFQLAVDEAATTAWTLTWNVFEAGPRKMRNHSRIIERYDSDFLQGDGNADADSIIVATRLGSIRIVAVFRRIADGDKERIAIGTSTATR